MGTRSEFRILVGVDGSAPARTALTAVLRGPWPDTTRVRAVVARQTRAPHQRSIVLSMLDRSADDAAERARRTLIKRWPEAEAVVLDAEPVAGILSAAKAFHAHVIVVGWRGHGPARRLMLGSVSRGIVRRATSAVLVVRRAPAHMQRVVLAYDGSPNARRAVRLLARLSPGNVTLVQVLDLLMPTDRGPVVGGVRTSIARRLRELNKERSESAIAALHRVAEELRGKGWRTHVQLKTGEPLSGLIDAVKRSRAELLVAGARGTSGLHQLLLGSVAEGLLNQSPVPVLLAR